MGNETGEALRISIRVWIVSLLIFTIAGFTYYGRTGYVIVQSRKSIADNLETKAELYDFDSKYVYGADMLKVITSNARRYAFRVYKYTGVIGTSYTVLNIDSNQEGTLELRYWSVENIKSRFKNAFGLDWTYLDGKEVYSELLWRENGADVYRTEAQIEAIGDSLEHYVIAGIQFSIEGV